MAIVSSQIVEDLTQVDGRRHVRERHTDHTGEHWFVSYMALAGDDVQAIMSARVPVLEAQIKDAELETGLVIAIGDGPAIQPQLDWNTNTEFGLRLRERYKISTARDAYRIGWYVDQFNLTDNQLKNFFGLSDAQLPAARAKIEDYAAKYETMIAAFGE